MTVSIIRDNREKKPYAFAGYDVVVSEATLLTGDYTIEGYEDVFSVERKSLPDLMNSISWERQRFKNEIGRANDLAKFIVVIEAPRERVEAGQYRSKMHPNSVFGTLKSWTMHNNVEFFWCGNRASAEKFTYEKLVEWRDNYERLF